ncbi:tyrosine-protein phosphatase 10D-like [Penaeus monodon]|uniref:tyrosine-protein phosphatase 10D-like n=1 Tax=Penaeus monodon TaxID=6687 RepID=UPI0018A7CC91|nr:tyrosine-protein phosphatase 10D-like [Penaeus monodon]
MVISHADMDYLRRRRLTLCLCVVSAFIAKAWSADVVIQIPSERVREQDGLYRLDYWPPQGSPPPNSTFTPAQVVAGVNLTRVLPGTKYDFQLYYTNATINDYPTWTASITTVPRPPTNLTIQSKKGKVVYVTWAPPAIGDYSAFKLKVIPLSEPQNSNKIVIVPENQLPFPIRELTPGPQQAQLFPPNYEKKGERTPRETSLRRVSPNTPGRFIVWFRNETTMLVLWQPPYPSGVYSHYRTRFQGFIIPEFSAKVY